MNAARSLAPATAEVVTEAELAEHPCKRDGRVHQALNQIFA